MFLWRISNHADLAGLGGKYLSGRWHTAAPDKRIVYFAEHPAVALIENLANLRGDPSLFPATYQLLKVAADGLSYAEELSPAQLNRIDQDDFTGTQDIGDAWLAARTAVLLRVPSIPSPQSWNYLMNPLHRDAPGVRVVTAQSITYDRRFFRLKNL